MAEQAADLEIMGQKLKFPVNGWFALVASILVLGISIPYTIGTYKNPDLINKSIAIIKGATYDSEGRSTEPTKATIFEFWTPDKETIRDLEQSQSQTGLTKEQRQWYSTDDETLKKFAKALRAQGVQGYTRQLGWGEGTTGLKRGWTWRVTVPTSTGFTRNELLTLYKQYFLRDKGIYIEEIRLGETLFKAE